MGDDFMKSALDRAMERADRIEVPAEKLEEMKYQTEGQRLASQFLKEPGFSLTEAVNQYEASERKAVAEALQSILLQNLVLPRKDTDFAGNGRIFEGIMELKKNKEAVQQAREQLENLSAYYAQARKQYYDQLKSQFEQALAQQLRQQTGTSPSGNLNVEQRPEFQEKWRQLSAQLDGQYEQSLKDLREQIAALV